MKTALELFFDPAVYGHKLVEPVQWYGKRIHQVFAEPLPEGAISAFADLVVRIVTLAALVFASPLLVAAAPVALLGWGVKYYSHSTGESVKEPIKTKDPVELQGGTDSKSPRTQDGVEPGPQVHSGPVPTEEIEKAAKQRADALGRRFDGMKEFTDANMQEIREELEAFFRDYGEYRAEGSLEKSFLLMDELDKIQKFVRSWADYKMLVDERGVVEQPGDGNCWLHTAITGLKLMDHPGVSHLGDRPHETLRREVVEWMYLNYETNEDFQATVIAAVSVHCEAKEQNLNMQLGNLTSEVVGDRPEREVGMERRRLLAELEALKDFSYKEYFDHAKKDRSFGTSAEFYAISRMFNVGIAIWEETNNGSLIRNKTRGIVCPGSTDTINVVETKEKDHFNYKMPEPADEKPLLPEPADNQE